MQISFMEKYQFMHTIGTNFFLIKQELPVLKEYFFIQR